MAARVIHFGPDDCHRLMVLDSAGFAVEACASLNQFRASLLSGNHPDAVLLSDGEGFSPEDAAVLARSCSPAPVVLFSGANRTYQGARFDLVVYSLTPPEVWLHEVDALIAKSRLLGGQLLALSRKSTRRVEASTLAVNKARPESTRSVHEMARNPGLPTADRLGQDSPAQDSVLKFRRL